LKRNSEGSADWGRVGPRRDERSENYERPTKNGTRFVKRWGARRPKLNCRGGGGGTPMDNKKGWGGKKKKRRDKETLGGNLESSESLKGDRHVGRHSLAGSTVGANIKLKKMCKKPGILTKGIGGKKRSLRWFGVYSWLGNTGNVEVAATRGGREKRGWDTGDFRGRGMPSERASCV